MPSRCHAYYLKVGGNLCKLISIVTPELDRITINPQYPVLDENDESPNFELPLKIWSRDNPKPDFTNPCTIDMTRSEISFHFNKFKQAPDAEIRLTSLQIVGELEKSPTRVVLTNGDCGVGIVEGGVFTTTLAPPVYDPSKPPTADSALPWGIKDQITWTIKYQFETISDSGPTSNTSSLNIKHHMEIYAVTPFTGSYKTRPAHYQGMPRAALEFYLITARKWDYTNQAGYIRSIVEAAHADTGNAYDVWGGAPSFSGSGTNEENNCYFNISLWARHLRPSFRLPLSKMLNKGGARSPEFAGHYVNCYDQAAVVWTGVTLALRNQKEAADLVWCFVQPFGYIKETKLVGWCYNPDSDDGNPNQKTDNPFFGAQPGLQLLQESHQDEDIRSAFGNHAFLQYKGKPLDATCGPHCGDKTLEEYLEGIDLTTSWAKMQKPNSWWYQATHHTKDTAQRKQAEEYGGATPEYVRSMHGPRKIEPRSIFDDGNHALEEYQGKYGVIQFDTPPLEVNAKNDQVQALWNILIEKKGVKRPNEGGHWVLSVDALLWFIGSGLGKCMDTQGNTYSEVVINRLTEKGAHFSWIITPPPRKPQVLVDMFVLPNSKQATDLFVTRVLPQDNNFKTLAYDFLPSPEGHDGLCAEHEDSGRGKIICVTRNIVYIIEGQGYNKSLKPYQDVIREYLSDKNADSLDRSWIKLNEKPVGSDPHAFKVQPNEHLEMKIEVGGDTTSMFNLDQQHKWVLTPTRSERCYGMSSYMKFRFRARNEGKDTFSIFACRGTLAPRDQDHLDVQEVSVEVTVG
ncbi:unnamed protein product [Rhizoctonia solani]|uniref:Uncharacterized protein n=1 Tax=Rhizoctonia solani TaxID=456999 RepID=A0A8H3HFA2_9AGAM|nr:unnamed protein product [Rhizoctonia solani]